MAESIPNWEEFKKIVQREVDRYFGCGATLMAIEVWEPEGTYKYKRKKQPRSDEGKE